MKIEVIDTNVASYGRKHISKVAWENSRPHGDDLKLKEILKLDLPVNEIPTAVLFIESTILEREIFVTLRNHVMWAQTSRVQNILKFNYPKVFTEEENIFFENQRNKMLTDSQTGVRQDEYRKHLPLMSNTKYTISVSMRDLIKLMKFFEEAAENIPHLKELFSQSAKTIYNVLYNYFLISDKEIAKYKLKPILTPILSRQDGRVGDAVVVHTLMPLSLRAQLARHRQLLIQDNLFELMMQKDISMQTNEMLVSVQVTGLISDWIEVIKKRNCWIAQYDLWSDLLNKAIKLTGIPEENLLPCSDGKCPYEGDAEARYTNKDPNAPCPIHAQLTERSVTTSQLKEMDFQAVQDNRSEFWFKKIECFNESA